MIWRLISPTLAILLVACSTKWTEPPPRVPNPRAPILVCLDLPAEHMPAAIQAVMLWDRALHSWRPVEAHFQLDLDCQVWVHETTRANPESPNALAWASDVGGHEISMLKGHYEQDVAGILLHELGHALGAQHVVGELMTPNWVPGAFRCPDVTTVAQVAAWNHTRLDKLSWCY